MHLNALKCTHMCLNALICTEMQISDKAIKNDVLLQCRCAQMHPYGPFWTEVVLACTLILKNSKNHIVIASPIFSTSYIKITFFDQHWKLGLPSVVAFTSSYPHMHFNAKKIQDSNCNCESVFSSFCIEITFLTNAEDLVYRLWLHLHSNSLAWTLTQKMERISMWLLLYF